MSLGLCHRPGLRRHPLGRRPKTRQDCHLGNRVDHLPACGGELVRVAHCRDEGGKLRVFLGLDVQLGNEVLNRLLAQFFDEGAGEVKVFAAEQALDAAHLNRCMRHGHNQVEGPPLEPDRRDVSPDLALGTALANLIFGSDAVV